MAKTTSTNNELLDQILLDLDTIIQNAGLGKSGASKKSSATNTTNTNTSSKAAEADALQKANLMQVLGGILKELPMLLKKMRLVSDKDVEHTIGVIKGISKGFSEIKIESSKENNEKLTSFFNSISSIFDTLTKVSNMTFKQYMRFNPTIGKKLGERIGAFFKAFMDGFNSSGALEVMGAPKGWQGGIVTEDITNDNGKLTSKKTFHEIKNPMIQLMEILMQFLNMSTKLLGKIIWALKLLPMSSAGKSLGKFFRAIVEPMFELVGKETPIETVIIGYDDNGNRYKEKVYTYKRFGAAINGITSLLSALKESISMKLIKALAYAEKNKVLNGTTGRAIGSFIVGIIKPMESAMKDPLFDAAIAALDVTLISIGKAVSAFAELLAAAGDSIKKAVLSLVILIGGLTLTVIALVLLTKIASTKTIMEAFGIMSLVVLESMGIMVTLGMVSLVAVNDTSASIKSLLILIGGLTGVLIACAAIVKICDKSTLNKAFGLLLKMLIYSGILIVVLTKFGGDNLKMSMSTAGGIALLLITLTAITFIFSLLAPREKEVNKGMVLMLKAMGILTLFLIIIGKFSPLIALAGPALKSVAIGMAIIVAVTGLFLLIVGLAKKAGITREYAWGVGGIVIDMFMMVSGVFIILAMLCAVPVVGKAIMTGAGAVTLIMLGIVACVIGIVACVWVFADALAKLKDIPKEKILELIDLIAGKKGEDPAKSDSIVGGIARCIDAIMKCVSVKAVLFLGIMSREIMPLMQSLGMFVDVIQKMAHMTAIDKILEDGTIVYKPFDIKDFGLAADLLSEGFGTFMTTLATAFGEDGKNIKNLRKVLDALFPVSGKLNLLGYYLKTYRDTATFAALIQALGQFVDIVVKLAALLVPCEWNENGDPIKYLTISDGIFKTAAEQLATGFTAFMEELSTAFGDGSINMWLLTLVLNTLFSTDKEKPGFNNLMEGLGGFVDTIIKLGNWQLVKEYKEDGTPVYMTVEEKDAAVTNAATTISKAFTIFMKDLSDWAEGTNKKAVKIIKKLSKNGLGELMASVGQFMQPVLALAAGTMEIGGKTVDLKDVDLTDAATRISTSMTTFLRKISNFVGEGDDAISTDSFDTFADILETIVDPIKSFLNLNVGEDCNRFEKIADSLVAGNTKISALLKVYASSDAWQGANIFDRVYTSMADVLTNWMNVTDRFNKKTDIFNAAINRLDTTLITKEQMRIKSLNNIRVNFDAITESVKKLNEALKRLMGTLMQFKNANDSQFFTKWEEMLNKQKELLDKHAQDLTNAVAQMTEANGDKEALLVTFDQSIITRAINGIRLSGDIENQYDHRENQSVSLTMGS